MWQKLKETIIEKWFLIESIFYFQFFISVDGLSIQFTIFDYGFRLGIDIPNVIPFSFHSIWDRFKPITEHKFFEEQISFSSDFRTGFEYGLFVHQDHDGFKSSVCLLGLEYNYNILDNRHWNYEKNRYKIYPDEVDQY